MDDASEPTFSYDRLNIMSKQTDPGDVVRVIRGVWLPAALAGTEVARLAAMLAALPRGTVLSGPTAARLHGMWVPRHDLEHVTVPAGPLGAQRVTVPQRKDLVAHRSALSPEDVGLHHGLPLTSVTRTWYDLAAKLSVPDLVAAGDAALRLHTATTEELGAAALRRARRPGAVRARIAAGLLDGAARSRPESHLRVALVSAGLPRPQVNVAVCDEHGGWLAEPDLVYASARLAIEYQGADHADPRRMRKDVTRHMDLRRAGWEVLYYTADQVFTRPEQAVDDVCRLLAVRAPHLLAGIRGRPRR